MIFEWSEQIKNQSKSIDFPALFSINHKIFYKSILTHVLVENYLIDLNSAYLQWILQNLNIEINYKISEKHSTVVAYLFILNPL